jgi:hypothetical protein
MSAGGTILLAGLGGAAGAYASSVVADEMRVNGDPVNVAAVGSAIGAVIGTIIGLSVTSADKKTGTLSGAPSEPPMLLGWP